MRIGYKIYIPSYMAQLPVWADNRVKPGYDD
jgi:hypothetical protein